jgi:hypothetical protein
LGDAEWIILALLAPPTRRAVARSYLLRHDKLKVD